MRYFYKYSSPIGYLDIVEKDGYITNINISNKVNNSTYILRKTPLISSTIRQLDEYFKGKRKVFDIPINPYGTQFQVAVWEDLLKIPYGEKKSYQDVAKDIGSPKSSRAIGGSVGKNPILIVIPCHRILGKDNSLTGFSAGIEVKKYLLNLEGIKYK